MNEKVLILGGSYFVGRKMTEYLVKLGYDVTVLNRGTRILPEVCVHQIKCDRNNLDAMKDALKDQQFEYVIDVSWKDLSWVKNTCEALSFTNVKKMIFISSSAVYDVDALRIPFQENDMLGENKYWTFYGKGKIEAENYYCQFLKDTSTDLIILRPPYIYGEYNYAQRESLIFRQLIEDKPIAIPKSNPRLQFNYTEDLADIIYCLLNSKLPKTYIANVGNQKDVTSLEWIEACAGVVGKKPHLVEVDYTKMGMNVRDFYPFFDYDNVLDLRRIHSIWNQETDFRVGLERAYEWFLKNRSEIIFKENVDKSLYEIIAAMSV